MNSNLEVVSDNWPLPFAHRIDSDPLIEEMGVEPRWIKGQNYPAPSNLPFLVYLCFNNIFYKLSYFCPCFEHLYVTLLF